VIAEQAAGLHSLHEAGHQVLLALDPLQVRALADVALTPKGQRLEAPDVMPARAQVQAGLRVVDGPGQADVHPADVVDQVLEAGEGEPDVMVDPDARLALDRVPQAQWPA